MSEKKPCVLCNGVRRAMNRIGIPINQLGGGPRAAPFWKRGPGSTVTPCFSGAECRAKRSAAANLQGGGGVKLCPGCVPMVAEKVAGSDGAAIVE